jgi:hypothetical protein
MRQYKSLSTESAAVVVVPAAVLILVHGMENVDAA